MGKCARVDGSGLHRDYSYLQASGGVHACALARGNADRVVACAHPIRVAKCCVSAGGIAARAAAYRTRLLFAAAHGTSWCSR